MKSALTNDRNIGWLNMRHSTSKKIFTYWNNLRGSRMAPDRCEIEPSDIRDILGDTFILEIDMQYRSISFRLAGTRLCNAHGRELKGVGFMVLWDEVDNQKVLETVRQVYETSSPQVMSYIAESEGKKFVEFEMLLLPLENSGSKTIRVLGTATPMESEAWIGADPLVNNRFKSKRNIDLTQNVEAPSIETEVPVHLTNSDMSSSDGSSPRKVAHLTVFNGGITD